jgi:hypothetical protein
LDLSVIGPWLVAAVLVAVSLGAFFKGMTGLGLPLFRMSAAIGTQLFTPGRLALSIAALAPTLVFTKVGVSLAGKISTTVFSRILLVTFLVMGIKLLADVL